jgi:hypothetical protein
LNVASMIDVKHRGQGRPNLYVIRIKAAFWRKNK